MNELPERSGRILSALVEAFIETGEPVSSAVIARQSGCGLSSATVRSVLASLEQLGYVRQPHTSAGRAPTDLGYRYYVDRLLHDRKPTRTAAAVEARLRRQPGTVGEILTDASHLLSRASHHVGFAIAPATESASFHQIEFIKLIGSKVLVVLVTRGGDVSEKVVDIGEELKGDELREAANYLNAELAGMLLTEARQAVKERLDRERTVYDALLRRALRLAAATLQEAIARAAVYVDGAASMLDAGPSLHSAEMLASLKSLLELLEQKDRLIRLLGQYLDDSGLTVVIGAEHNVRDLRDVSVIASKYGVGDRAGVVGVIGPTRMQYSRAIAVVDGVAEAVARILRDDN